MENRQRIIATIAIILLLVIVFIKVGQFMPSVGRASVGSIGTYINCVILRQSGGTIACVDPYAPAP